MDKEIIKRLKQRAETLKIDIKIPETLNYKDLLEISEKLYIDYLRLLSPAYKSIEILYLKSGLDDNTRKIINIAEEVIHILYERIDCSKLNKLILKQNFENVFLILRIEKIVLVIESSNDYEESVNKKIEENIELFSKNNIEKIKEFFLIKS